MDNLATPARPGEWSAATPPNADSSYDHCECDTPLGRAVIEWKSWKRYPGFVLEMAGEHLGCFDTLDEAKEAAIEQVKIVGSKCSAWVSKVEARRSDAA